MKENKNVKIKIIENGLYIVTGNVPLEEKTITPKGGSVEFKDGRELPQAEQYALCRCGESDIKPFCDANHMSVEFNDGEGIV